MAQRSCLYYFNNLNFYSGGKLIGLFHNDTEKRDAIRLAMSAWMKQINRLNLKTLFHKIKIVKNVKEPQKCQKYWL